MIKVLLIDDEPLARSLLKEYLEGFQDISIVEECNDGFEGLKAIQTHKPDLIFLDIQMPKISGFELLELIEEPVSIIFTTAFDEYAIKAFEANAIDYLLKPFGKDRLQKSMHKFLSLHSKNNINDYSKIESNHTALERIVVKVENQIKLIPLDDIFYLQAEDDYVKIQSVEGAFLKKKTMNYFEQHLPAHSFVRVHRSYILNIKQIVKLESFEKDQYLAVLKNDIRIPVSKSGYPRLKSILGI